MRPVMMLQSRSAAQLVCVLLTSTFDTVYVTDKEIRRLLLQRSVRSRDVGNGMLNERRFDKSGGCK